MFLPRYSGNGRRAQCDRKAHGGKMTEKRGPWADFPSGLEQPEGSFRFSADALLLASFAGEMLSHREAFFVELGTGCGVAALALLREKPLWRAVGVEIMPPLAEAAGRNAARLGLEERFCVVEGDVADRATLRRARGAFLSEGSERLFPMVMCNPPWRREGEGRLPPSLLRRTALFGTEETFRNFFQAADGLLEQGGVLAVVSGAERTAEALEALPPRLHPELLRFIFTKKDSPAAFVLLCARKNGRAALRVEKREVW